MRNKILILCLLTLFCMLPGCGEREEIKEIAVIVKATDSDFWRRVSDGVNAVATEYNVNVTFSGPGSEEDYLTQNSLIVSAVARGADALVISATD